MLRAKEVNYYMRRGVRMPPRPPLTFFLCVFDGSFFEHVGKSLLIQEKLLRIPDLLFVIYAEKLGPQVTSKNYVNYFRKR